jgi:hypothetical protein
MSPCWPQGWDELKYLQWKVHQVLVPEQLSSTPSPKPQPLMEQGWLPVLAGGLCQVELRAAVLRAGKGLGRVGAPHNRGPWCSPCYLAAPCPAADRLAPKFPIGPST